MIPVLMIPYDTIHIMYAQGLVWATGLKERQTSLSFLTIINIHILTSTIVQTSKFATWLI